MKCFRCEREGELGVRDSVRGRFTCYQCESLKTQQVSDILYPDSGDAVRKLEQRVALLESLLTELAEVTSEEWKSHVKYKIAALKKEQELI